MYQRSTLLHRTERDTLHDGITPTHLSLRVDGNDRLLHAIEQCGQLAAAALERVKALLQAARRHVERVGNGRNLIQIALFHTGR